MRRKNHSHQQDIDDLKKHNAILEQQSKYIHNIAHYITHLKKLAPMILDLLSCEIKIYGFYLSGTICYMRYWRAKMSCFNV